MRVCSVGLARSWTPGNERGLEVRHMITAEGLGMLHKHGARLGYKVFAFGWVYEQGFWLGI